MKKKRKQCNFVVVVNVCTGWLNEKLLICAVNTPQPSVTELRKARGNLPFAYHECPDFRERFDQDQYSLPPGARALLRD